MHARYPHTSVCKGISLGDVMPCLGPASPNAAGKGVRVRACQALTHWQVVHSPDCLSYQTHTPWAYCRNQCPIQITAVSCSPSYDRALWARALCFKFDISCPSVLIHGFKTNVEKWLWLDHAGCRLPYSTLVIVLSRFISHKAIHQMFKEWLYHI